MPGVAIPARNARRLTIAQARCRSRRVEPSALSKQALDSEGVRNGLKDILLGPAQLYEALREQGLNQKPPL